MEPTARLKQAVREYKQGKAEAFNTLYNESSQYVYTCIYKVMSGNDNAQDSINDIMQDTYVEISKYISQLDDEDRFLSWAGTIATRKCYAYLKKNNKYVLLNEDDNTFDNLSDDDNIIPEEVMQDKEKQRLIRNIIETELSEMQKLCIIAFYYNEQKRSEIAKELGIPENTVKTHLARAKAKIKDGVLDLEKKQGTRLYSVAPFLLLLFKEDVQAAVVPEGIFKSIMSATTAVSAGTTSVGAVTTSATTAGATATKGMLAKIAAASIKTKIIASLVTVSVIGGGTAGAVYAVNQQEKAVVAEVEAVTEIDSATENNRIAVVEQVANTVVSDEENESIHSHEYTETITTDATCEADGLKTFTCECGDTYTETIPATGHIFENYISNNDATYTADGTETAKCNTCDLTDTRTAEGSKLEYTYTEMNATMYATQTVNVRNLPSTDGEKIGSLSTNQEVAVTGQCNETSWYRFELDGQVAFVSNEYLSNEKVEVQQTPLASNIPSPYDYPEGIWVDMGGWMFKVADGDYASGNDPERYAAYDTLKARYPEAQSWYLYGFHLNNGSGKWCWLVYLDVTSSETNQFFGTYVCNCDEPTHGGTKY